MQFGQKILAYARSLACPLFMCASKAQAPKKVAPVWEQLFSSDQIDVGHVI
jgi:hypothetical protein